MTEQELNELVELRKINAMLSQTIEDQRNEIREAERARDSIAGTLIAENEELSQENSRRRKWEMDIMSGLRKQLEDLEQSGDNAYFNGFEDAIQFIEQFGKGSWNNDD